MTELLCVVLLYLAAVLWYASERRPDPVLQSWLVPGYRANTARFVAFAAAGCAWLLWRGLEPGPAGALVTLTGFIVSSTLVTLLASVAPRLVRALAVICVAALPVLIWRGVP